MSNNVPLRGKALSVAGNLQVTVEAVRRLRASLLPPQPEKDECHPVLTPDSDLATVLSEADSLTRQLSDHLVELELAVNGDVFEGRPAKPIAIPGPALSRRAAP